MYDFRCPDGHRFERLVPMSGEAEQECPACGAPGRKTPSLGAMIGVARTGLPMERMPQTWKGTHNADPEYTTMLRRTWDRRQRLEDKHPELRGDRRPIIAHEGRYHHEPLRAGEAPTGGSGES